MKTSRLIFAGILLLSLSNISKAGVQHTCAADGANDTLTVSFRVNGNPSCESGIEGALTTHAGVISASWVPGTKQITVKYLSSQVQASDLHSYLALAGYDTSELRAKQPAYDALQADCKYQRDQETE